MKYGLSLHVSSSYKFSGKGAEKDKVKLNEMNVLKWSNFCFKMFRFGNNSSNNGVNKGFTHNMR